ncbi:MAG: hypothetical protein A2Z25_17040 [Planctomycetes bacterium RBG_16_55_9]|nr:MAG: hypothetical protein A2Z25_17040 [Planctomycetes bacterium RBG_16_55_9]
MEVLRWRTHLHPVLAAAMILILAVWLIVVFRRQRTNRTLKQTILLSTPKILIVLLLILAYFDPVRSVIQRPKRDKKILVLVDASSSMDCRDESGVSRAGRAERLSQSLTEKLRPLIDVETLYFDDEVRNAKDTDQVRGTDLGKCLVTIADKAKSSDYLSAVVLTDGGDEVIQTPKQPDVPLYVTGVGSDPDSWNDLSVAEVDVPTIVELGGTFEVSTDILARFASRDFALNVPMIRVQLEAQRQGQWQALESKFVRPETSKSRVTFALHAPSEPGLKEYRIQVENTKGELSALNNVRQFNVDVRTDTLHVLFFAQELGWDFSMIRKELARDPSVELTALFRVSGQRFVVQGSRQKGDEQLEAGFPASKEVLDLFKCVIVGAFGASQWTPEQLNALLDYVRDGGAAVFLGGENSFGSGDYERTTIEPLFPWRLSGARSTFQIGRFAVSVPAAALDSSIIEEAAKIISQLDAVAVESVNVEGPLKSGAVALLEASVAGRSVPLISIQRYGQGQTMAVATNTLWKWCRASDELRDAYGAFWRQAVKNITDWEEGQRFIAVKWDQKQYNPGEDGVATISIAGRHEAGRLRLDARINIEGETPSIRKGGTPSPRQSTPVPVEPVMGRTNTFTTKMNFSRSDQYHFELDALEGDQLLESYKKTIVVGTRLNEGANLEVDHAFLDSLAAQAGGRYFREGEFENLIGMLRSRILGRVVSMEIPLIEDKFIYILVFVGILVFEWIIRRRMNLL